MLVIENCNSLSDLRQKLIDGEEVRTARDKPCEDAIRREDALMALCRAVHKNDDTIPCSNQIVSCLWSKTKVQDYAREIYKLPSINSQPKTGHWIPVSEELPDKEGYYLCSVRYMYPPYNFFEPEKVKYMDDVTIQKFDGEFNIEVKAWMPLPAPFEPQESEGKE